MSREGGRAGLPKKGKWPPRGTGMTVLTYPCPTASRVSVAVRGSARVTGKAGENGQHSGEMGGSSPWTRPSAPGCTYLRNVTDLLSDGKTPYERRFGQPFKGPIIPFGSLVEYHLITAKDQSRIHQFGKKVLPGLFLGYALYDGRIWKGDVLVAHFEELETMDASEIYSK